MLTFNLTALKTVLNTTLSMFGSGSDMNWIPPAAKLELTEISSGSMSVIFWKMLLKEASNGVFLYCSRRGMIADTVNSSPSESITLFMKNVGSV